MEDHKEAKQVLIVDDEKDIRDGCERILRRMGCKVFKAPRGDEGLRVLTETEGQISIVLLDLKMPGMDGMEVLKRIKEMDESILVIIITGFATIETAIEAMKQGAYDFIPKPFEPDHVRIVVGRAFEKLRLTWEAEKSERERRRTLLDLDTEKSRIRTVIESLPNGVMVTNAIGQVVLMNPAFLRQLDLDPGRTPGDQTAAYVQDTGFCELAADISHGKYSDSDEIPSYETALENGKYFQVRGKPVMGEDGECLGAVVNLVDITAMKELDRLKSEFVAKVSHELRSPLSTIHEQLALVLKEMVGNEAQDQHLLARAKEKTGGLITLIGDILDLSRIESGTIRHDPKPVHLDDLLKSIVDFLGTRAKTKEQSLVLELPESSLPTITADPMSLESIFGNLITNAINYTQEGGEITVSGDFSEEPDLGRMLRVKVEDNGFGIELRHQEKIFDRFFRVKNDKTRFITGTGLGLPIVKGLVDSLGGDIRLDSEPGKGTKFTVLLPFEAGVFTS
ncbi:response regulator [Desulfococcaceae bacterium HSG8]|nr:response regulator [Desulfococcaceae bacterium HSG8]